MSYSRSNLDLSNVYQNRINVNEIISNGLKVRSKYIVCNKDLSVPSDIVGTIYLCQQNVSTSATGSFTSTTITVETGLGLTSGMFINVKDAISEVNNNVYEIDSYISSTGVITIKTSGAQFFCKTSFVAESAVGVTVSNVTLFITKVESGVYSTSTSSTSASISYNPIPNNSTGSSTDNALATWNGSNGSNLNNTDLLYLNGTLSFPTSTNTIIRRGTTKGIQLTDGQNFGVGPNVFNSLVSGNKNICIGSDNCGANLMNGLRNIFLGQNAGSNITTENDNILLYNNGIVGVDGRIAIGTSGIHNTTFISGITGVTPAGSTTQNVIIDSNGQLGTGSPSINNRVWAELVYQGTTLITTTTIALTTNVYAEININGSLSSAGDTFSQSSNGRIRYEGVSQRTFFCFFSITGRLASGTTSKTIAYELRINGSTVTNSRDQGYYLNSTNFTPYENLKTVTLNPNDYVSIFIVNSSDGTDASIYMMKIHLLEV